MYYFKGEYVITGKPGTVVELAPGVSAKVVEEKRRLCHTSRKQTHVCFWEGDLSIVLDIEGNQVTVNDHDEQKGTKSPFVYKGQMHYIQGRRFHIDEDEVVRLRYTVFRPNTNTTTHSKEHSYHRYNLGEEFTIAIDECPTEITPDSGLVVVATNCKNNTLTLKGATSGRKKLVVDDRETYFDIAETKGVYRLGEEFTVGFHNNYTTGSSIKLVPSDGLVVVDNHFDLACEEVGCGGKMTYILKGTTRGKKELLVRSGQMWNPETVSETKMEFEIV